MTTHDELRALHSQPVPRSEKAIAIAESEVWSNYVHQSRVAGQKVPNRREWFRDTFGTSAMETDRRSRILGRGQLADPIWDLLSAGRVSMDAACNALVEAEASADPEGKIREFCDLMLSPKDGYHEVKTSTGKTMVKRKPQRASFSDPGEEFDASSAKKAAVAVMEVADRFLASRLDGIEDYGMRKTLSEDFRFSVQVACEELVKGAAKLRSRGHSQQSVRRVSLRESFEALGIAPPKKAMSDEDRSRAYNAFRKLAKTYHPDRNPGDEGALSQYRAVNVAWATIREHTE